MKIYEKQITTSAISGSAHLFSKPTAHTALAGVRGLTPKRQDRAYLAKIDGSLTRKAWGHNQGRQFEFFPCGKFSESFLSSQHSQSATGGTYILSTTSSWLDHGVCQYHRHHRVKSNIEDNCWTRGLLVVLSSLKLHVITISTLTKVSFSYIAILNSLSLTRKNGIFLQLHQSLTAYNSHIC